MTKGRSGDSHRVSMHDGYKPLGLSTNGFRPSAPSGGMGNVQGGHIPSTSQGGSNTPPNQGGSGKK